MNDLKWICYKNCHRELSVNQWVIAWVWTLWSLYKIVWRNLKWSSQQNFRETDASLSWFNFFGFSLKSHIGSSLTICGQLLLSVDAFSHIILSLCPFGFLPLYGPLNYEKSAVSFIVIVPLLSSKCIRSRSQSCASVGLKVIINTVVMLCTVENIPGPISLLTC